MNRILIALILATQTKPATLWFDVFDVVRPYYSMTIAGPNEEYVVQGSIKVYSSFQIDWEAGTSNFVKALTSANTALVANSRVEGHEGSFNCVIASATLVRYNCQQGVESNEQEYPVPTGAHYGHPASILAPTMW